MSKLSYLHPFLSVWCTVVPDLPIQSLNSSTGKPMPLPIHYKVMQPITIRAALDRVGHGVRLAGVWVSDIASVPVVLFLEIW